MGFGSLSNNQRILVLLELLGGPKYAASMSEASAQTLKFRRAQQLANREMALTTRRTWLQNQALFTMRRYAFYGTLAVTALAIGLGKLGYSYLSAMQQAQVALSPVIKNHEVLQGYLNRLFTISKFSPFVITDLAVAFRQMFAGLNPLGMNGNQIINIMQALTDFMSASGKLSPGQMQRAALAIQHMAYAGRLTGYAANQLSRLGVPVSPILARMGITDVHNLGKLNVSAQTFLQAMIGYSNTAQYRNAARRQALRTLPGLFQVTRDTISQISGNLLRGTYGGPHSGVQGFFTRLYAPGGPMSGLGGNMTGTRQLFQLNRAVTGNTGLARGLLLLLSIAKNLALVFARVLVPAFVLGLHSLIYFWPQLKLLNYGLAFMARHANILKYVFAALAAEFILTHSALLGLWTAQKLYMIATFGGLGRLKIYIKYIKILRDVEIAGMLIRLKEWAFATTFLDAANNKLLQSPMFKNKSFWAKITRGIFIVAGAIQTAAIATWEWTAALLANPITWIVIAAVATTAFIVLYATWGKFRKEVNGFVTSMRPWAVAIKLALTAAFGPLIWIIQGLMWISKHFGGGVSSAVPSMQTGASGLRGSRGPSIAPIASSLPAGAGATAMRGITVHSQLIVDRKVLAESVARANADRKSLR